MENASKALIISAGVLIAILLLTLFSYLFMKMSSSTSEVYDMISKHEKDEFNQQFFNYEGRGIRTNADPLTPQEVATLINLAQDNSEILEFSVSFKCNRPVHDNSDIKNINFSNTSTSTGQESITSKANNIFSNLLKNGLNRAQDAIVGKLESMVENW